MQKTVTIRVLDNVELRSDGLNWMPWLLKEVKNAKTGELVDTWVFMGTYHQTVGGALRWLLAYLPKKHTSATERRDIAEYVSELEKMANQVSEAAKRLAKSVSKEGTVGK